MTENQQSTDIKTLKLENKFASLPHNFYTCLMPTPLKEPYLIAVSDPIVKSIGVDPELSEQEFCEVFSGNKLLTNSQPLAAVYSGHQFGVWAGQLGDGRAILLGDVANAGNSSRLEIQLKGAGMTPYSRMGDGRAVLRSSIREFLCSEAMEGLGIPTSRALCITGSDQYVMREEPETMAVVTRIAPSFVRFGSFEHWYYNNRPDELKILADFVIDNYFPELLASANQYQALLAEVTKRTAELMAHWQSVGFMHGVMNTDNMSILGLTLDYGPFGFMEAFDPKHICNHTDQQGRYSYQMQPSIGHWNCHAFAQAMLPLIGTVERTQDALNGYQRHFEEKYQQLTHRKLGLFQKIEGDRELIENFFSVMQENAADFTLTFRQLSHLHRDDNSQDHLIRDLFVNRDSINHWLIGYRARLRIEESEDTLRHKAMLAANPKYILRNYLAQIAIAKAQDKDFSEIKKLHQILQNPFDEQPEYNSYAALPPNWASTLEVSCSS